MGRPLTAPGQFRAAVRLRVQGEDTRGSIRADNMCLLSVTGIGA